MIMKLTFFRISYDKDVVEANIQKVPKCIIHTCSRAGSIPKSFDFDSMI